MTQPEERGAAAPVAKTGATPMSATPILSLALRGGVFFALAVAVVAGGIGLLTAGLPGLYGGLLGAATAAIYLGLTAGSMLVAGRVTKGDQTTPVFFGIVIGTWALKLVLFIVLLLWLGRQNWLDGRVFFFTVIVAVIGSLVIDCVAFIRGRVPYVSDVTLPGQNTAGDRAPIASDDSGQQS